MIELLARNLEYIRKERLRVRRKLCKFLRDNRGLVQEAWLQRKIDLRYLGDLTDPQLVRSVNKILRRKGDYYSEA
jgi:hypothetical protein